MKLSRSSGYLLAGLLLAACASGDGGGSSSGRGSVIASHQSALTGSSTLQAALSGKIIAPPSGPISTGMPGDPSVGDDGSASYRIPIWVPDGVNGLQPTLALEYNSEAATGLLGPRWRLTGLSTITRCPKTRAQDGVQTAVNFRDNVFCLDGQRMIVVGTIDATHTEFRTERDAFVKIVGVKDTTLNQYYQFTAYQKDGLISSFGTTALSRLHGNPHSWAGGWQADVNYAYYVDKIQDRYGNAINITYQNGIASPPPFGASGKTEVQELQPLTITWGPTGQRSVTFAYEGIPGGATVNPQVRYVSGLGIGMATYMSTITIKGPDGTPNPPPVLKQYKLTYDTNARPAVGPPLTIITGDRVLSTITECDGTSPTPICKKPTKIQWSAGSTGYTTADISAGIPDYGLGQSLDYHGVIRIIAADFNSDGRDDLVYRAWVPPHHFEDEGNPNPARDCAGWQARLTSIDVSGNPTFGSATALPLNADPDPSCLAHVISSTEWRNYKNFYEIPSGAYPGDVLFVDLNGDGLLDILSPIGQIYYRQGRDLDEVGDPIMVGYRAYLNQGGAGISFGLPANFLDSIGQEPSNNLGWNTLFPNPKHAALAIADIDGDGFLDVIRPNENPPQHLSAARIWSGVLTAKSQTRNGYTFNYSECATTTTGCNKPIANVLFPDDSTTFSDMAAVDIDGDGTAEIVRTATSCAGLPCGNWNGIAAVTSPTVNNVIINFPPAGKDSFYNQTRWFLDLNGDGLQDMVWVNTNLQSPPHVNDQDRLNQQVVWAAINTGQGFGAAKTTNLSYLWASMGPMVMDYNLDGRQDLLVTDFFPLPLMTVPEHAVYLKALISDGKGGFVEQVTTIPTPRYTITEYNTTQYYYGFRYQLTAVVLDLNGDGLPDTVQVDKNGQTSSVLQAHMRAGAAPLMMQDVYEGNGRIVSFEYAPANDLDTTFYTSNRSTSCGTDSTHLDCLNHGRWLVKSLTISSNGTDGGQAITPITQNFSYFNGVSDKHGRGFLGFTQRTIHGPGSRKTMITYDPLKRQANGNKYVYPYAMLPKTVSIDTDTPQTPQTPNSHYLSQQLTTYTAAGSVWQSNGTYAVFPVSMNSHSYDCMPSSPLGSCSSSLTVLGYQKATYTYDAYGNTTNRTVKFYDAGDTLLRTDTDVAHFQAADLESWLVALPDPTNPNTLRSVVGTEDVTRTVKITPDMTFNGVTGLRVGVVESIEFEPEGTSDVRMRRTFGRNPTTGQVSSVSDAALFPSSSACTTTCSGSCTPQCQTSCAPGPGQGACMTSCMNSCMNPCVQTCMAPGVVRTTSFSYADGSDGVYVVTMTNPMGHTTKVWRHPGYGVEVESIDENNLAATASYDTFGRLLSQTAISGASTTFSYPTGSANGMDVLIKPENLATRQVRVHYDSWGRELSKTVPIDAAQTLTTTTHYDEFGRVSFTDYGGLNTYVNTYDDLNRLRSVCHKVSDGSTQCRTNQYDGLTTTTTNESGLQATSIADALGRVATQRASVSGGTSDATYTYGAFGQLKQQQAKNNAGQVEGQTDFEYDVRGRQSRLGRTLGGGRATEYNAFGEVTKTYKYSATTTADPVTYGRDALGRLTSVTAADVTRSWYWDKTSAGASQTNAIGKLVDVLDGPVNGYRSSKVHFNYDPLGRLQEQQWSFPEMGGTFAWYTYDSQGRVATLRYPQRLTGSYATFKAQYAYDPYLGTVKSIADASTLNFLEVPTTFLWQAAARNARGQITIEWLKTEGGVELNKRNSYYLPTGALSQVSLGMGLYERRVTFTNVYRADGLLDNQTWSPQVGEPTWKSTFGYDNLGRMTGWNPNGLQPTDGYSVAYGYDSDGNLNTRSWSVCAPGIACSGASETVTYSVLGTAGRKATVVNPVAGMTVRTDNYAADMWGRINNTPSIALTYNALDEVISVTEKGSNQLDATVHDGFGNRLSTTYGANLAMDAQTVRLTLMDGLYELTRNGATQEERCRLMADGRVVGDVMRYSATGPKLATFYLTDNVGSVVAEAADNGMIEGRRRRDPYGNLLAYTGGPYLPYLPADPTGTNPDPPQNNPDIGTMRFGFADHPREKNWGLVDMRARMYAPALGRFISPDSVIGNTLDRRAYNPFAYVWNNPAAMNDPSGHYPGECGDCGRDGGDGVVSPPDGGGGGGPGFEPEGSELPPSAGTSPGHTPSNPYIGLTGTVPYGVQTTTNSSLSSSNHALRSHGPTDGSASQTRAAGAPWSCGARAKEANARLEDEADARAIHAYLMGHSEEYLRLDREQRERDAWAGTNGGMGTRSFADDIGEGVLTLGGSLAFRVVARTTLAARGAATLESRGPLGRVLGLQPGEGAAAGGSRIHLDIGLKMQGRYGGDWSGVLPGRNGPDWIPSQGTNATFGEIKSIWTGPGKITGQASKWGITGENISQGRYFFYDPATGNFWEGIIAP